MLPHEATDSPKLDNVQAPIETKLSPSEQHNIQIQQRARRLLGKQDYPGVIALFKDETEKGVDEKVLANEYLVAANSSLDQADSSMEQGHYAAAAILMKSVQDSYPRRSELQKKIVASPVQITQKIDICSEKLMEAGLVAYRSGAFTTALEIWQQILEFNPEHQAALNSIQTTQLQLSNLKNLNSKE
jgi:tetratricopeptide (TPR) repeat protein